ncbi:MAG: TetR/AcrR family transcriptional regulator [Bacteriovoracaceae bacterium]|jgi:AcrR family transcriptional regulator|nr:TetR/AcrR family transcriptional regulator [Bacteriovoracaceae bacterium]
MSEQRKSPKQGRSKKMIEDILCGTKLAIDKFGFDKISSAKISEQTGISVGSFYQYFKNKESVLLKFSKNKSLQILKAVDASLEETKNLNIYERADKLIELYIEHVYENPSLIKFMPKIVLALGQVSFFIENRQKITKKIEDIFVLEFSNIRNHKEQAYLYMAMINGSIQHLLQDDSYKVDKKQVLLSLKYQSKCFLQRLYKL